jgi:hypothetical protein
MSKQFKFQIGDRVVVSDCGQQYSSYDTMALKMGLNKWNSNRTNSVNNGVVATIVARNVHDDERVLLYGIESLAGTQHVMSENGLRLREESNTIKISREILNGYWDAATTEQREYINKHFQLDGTTTVDAIKGLRNIACDKWEKIIMSNHPEVFPEHSKYFDLKSLKRNGGSCIFTHEEAVAAGFHSSGFIQIANAILDGNYKDKGFYLSDSVNWEFHETECGGWVVVPTKKGK